MASDIPAGVRWRSNGGLSALAPVDVMRRHQLSLLILSAMLVQPLDVPTPVSQTDLQTRNTGADRECENLDSIESLAVALYAWRSQRGR